jgi:hypothetical protein
MGSFGFPIAFAVAGVIVTSAGWLLLWLERRTVQPTLH